MTKLTYERKSRAKTAAQQAPPSANTAREQTATLVETILGAGKGATTADPSETTSKRQPRPHQVIKLGIDVHHNHEYERLGYETIDRKLVLKNR